jgi:hypothetical protein
MGKQEKALSVLSKYHANGETDDPLVQWELHEIESALLQEASARSSYLDFFRTPGNLRRLAVILTISVGTNWVGNSLISYYLAQRRAFRPTTAFPHLLHRHVLLLSHRHGSLRDLRYLGQHNRRSGCHPVPFYILWYVSSRSTTARF